MTRRTRKSETRRKRTRRSKTKEEEKIEEEEEEEERWRVAWMSDEDLREGVARGNVEEWQ